MKTLVTGAAGFIGSSLVKELIARDVDVLGVDRDLSSGYHQRNIKGIGSQAEVLDLDLAGQERDCFAEIVRDFRPDTIVHLASLAGVRESVERRLEYFTNNLLSTLTVFEAASTFPTRLIAASTSSLYSPKPGPSREGDPLNAKHPYAKSKELLESLCEYYARDGIPSITIARFFTVFGPNGRTDMMPGKLLKAAKTGSEVPLYDPNQRRDWTYVGDLVKWISDFISAPAREGLEVVNFGSNSPKKLKDFIDLFESVSSIQIKFSRQPTPQTEAFETWADTAALTSVIGKQTPTNLEEAIRNTWNWAKETDEDLL